MRKSLLVILILLLTGVCIYAAAETEYALAPISGRISFNEDLYVVLTPDNLTEHPDLLADIGKNAEELKSDWEERGVLLQAWSKDKKTSVEVSVTQDGDSAKYYDLETQTGSVRNQYFKDQKEYYNKTKHYIIDSSEIKLHSKSGHYVVIEYICKDQEPARRGILRKTIRNGYTMCVDYEVYDRKPTKTDRDRSRHIINTVVIDTVAPVAVEPSASQTQTNDIIDSTVSSAASGTLSVTVLPPDETNDGVFTIEGKAYPNSKLIIVAMRWSGAVYRFYADATKKGDFKCKVVLPEEGLYQFTINMDINDQPAADAVLNAVTYSKTLLPVTLDAEIPEQLTSDQLVISGKTVRNAKVQCIVTNGIYTFDKTVTPSTGSFRFTVDTSAEAEYSITLAFEKKGLNSVQIRKTATRKLSEQDTQDRITKAAKHASYDVLLKKLDSYIGETMVFDAHIVSVEKKGDDWLITAAMKKSKGAYSKLLYYTASEEPAGLVPGEKVKLYGICRGAYQEQSEEGSEKYPDFDYICFK